MNLSGISPTSSQVGPRLYERACLREQECCVRNTVIEEDWHLFGLHADDVAVFLQNIQTALLGAVLLRIISLLCSALRSRR